MNEGTDRTKLRRMPARGSHDYCKVHEILKASFVAHIGFNVGGQPFVIPTLYAPSGELLYLHGSAASRMLKELEQGAPCCVAVTLVDGIVLARSAFNHSMNYRSVVAFGTARKVDEDSKVAALKIISEHVLSGRWNDVRPPTSKELKATSVIQFTIEEASVKIRSGPPIDDEEDYQSPAWAGVLPLEVAARAPLPDPRLLPETSIPEYILRFGNE